MKGWDWVVLALIALAVYAANGTHPYEGKVEVYGPNGELLSGE